MLLLLLSRCESNKIECLTASLDVHRMTRLTWKKVASAGIRTHQLQFDARPDLTSEFLEPLSRGKG